MPLLEVNNIGKRFGGLQAVKDVSFTVRTGMIKAVIGPNGAGKTTLFNLVSGSCRPIPGRSPSRIAQSTAKSPMRSPASDSPAPSSISGSFRT